MAKSKSVTKKKVSGKSGKRKGTRKRRKPKALKAFKDDFVPYEADKDETFAEAQENMSLKNYPSHLRANVEAYRAKK